MPCGGLQVENESHNWGRDGHARGTRGSHHCVSRWAVSLLVSFAKTLPKFVHMDHEHEAWRLAFPMSLSSTSFAIYDVTSV